ncbi:winged helix-turn-helix domain-containing protein [Chromobacterium subtsugae]|uniref:Winged helix-turn-helix domain-containing protein n=1 Tax=Chromobacterium subtsugae TaxID=251747 RepID=A0ABS7FHK9_9NEIS|nr:MULTISPECIES: winged helix-turn-helix domain-containing protein [Chromobacterium]KUM03599.1 chemotaxis protein CheY [Chromobacterium subtsugae]KZE85414.1 two-component system response regulator [Chromobacterium sp. F49]MBW7567628.1 winged helix-turn-helix domain-containing protein [Chromobacterium subtsugae]MBW8288744.1 winged helix-turn-helix domain-containing protein [Chromobacterium subtsugae]OBU87109.1 chemotaxis protein CheY [Chromobacterium subtsugae]
MAQHILIVEDDARLAELIAAYLTKHGYQVSLHGRGDTAPAAILDTRPDLVVLDVMLPGKEGFDVCRDVRPHYGGRILMMTARDEDVDEILGLELGADDYLAKPVEPRRLLARIRALLRRSGAARQDGGGVAVENDCIAFGQFNISQATREALLGDEQIELTTAEFDLLWLLATHAGQVLSRDDIMSELRGIGFDGLDRSIDARISRLRRKLGDNPDAPARIKTVRGKGYLFSRSDWE